jgi:hypothetical protein
MNGFISEAAPVFNENQGRTKALERAERASLPVLAGFLGEPIERPPQSIPARILRVWCPFCHQLHKHSWATRDRRPQLRKSHCRAFEAGYLIRPFTKREREAMGVIPAPPATESGDE